MKISSQTGFQDNGTLFLEEELEKIDPSQNIAKFYHLYFYGGKKNYFVMTQRGRISAKPVTEVKRFEEKEKAVEFFFKKMVEKKKKGYRKSEILSIPLSFYDFPMREISLQKIRKEPIKISSNAMQLDFFSYLSG